MSYTLIQNTTRSHRLDIRAVSIMVAQWRVPRDGYGSDCSIEEGNIWM